MTSNRDDSSAVCLTFHDDGDKKSFLILEELEAHSRGFSLKVKMFFTNQIEITGKNVCYI
jgi:hypothetical protein